MAGMIFSFISNMKKPGLAAINDQINREQKHANVFGEFHGVSILDRAFRLQSKTCNLIQMEKKVGFTSATCRKRQAKPQLCAIIQLRN